MKRHCSTHLTAALAGIIAAGVLAAPAAAHHSFAMYDMATTKTMTGRRKRSMNTVWRSR